MSRLTKKEQIPGGNESEGSNRNKDKPRTSARGFASMDPEQQRQIARKGGEAVSSNRQHMAEIGRKGGEASGGGRGNNSNGSNNNAE